MEEIQAVLDRIGTDNPPTADELRTAKESLVRLMREEGKQPRPDIEVLATMKDAHGKVAEALVEAEEAEAAVRAQVDELLADIQGGEGDPEDPDDEPEADPEAEDALDPDKEPVLAGGNVRILPLAEAAARVRNRPAAPEPAEQPSRVKTFVNGKEFRGNLGVRDIANEMRDAMRSPNMGKQTIVRFDTEAADGFRLPGDVAGNTAIIDSVVSPEAIAAAGGCCVMPEPIRGQQVLGSTARPIRDSLPTFGVANTGAVTFYPPICIPQDGVYEWTCEEDAAVDPTDPDTWKQCAVVECDDAVIVQVNAIYRCLTIGNFQRRFDSERWNAILQAVLISQARLAEIALWTKMRAQVSSTHILGNTGSVFASLVQGVGLAAATIRQDQRFEGLQLRLWGPSWLRDAIRADLVARRLVDAENPVAADTWINSQLGNLGVQMIFSPDINIIETPPQVSGPLTDWPAFAQLVLAPEGYYTFLDGGQFDLGTEIRDHDLNRQNAVATFAESFEGLMARGCNAKALDLPVAVCDLAAGCLPVS